MKHTITIADVTMVCRIEQWASKHVLILEQVCFGGYVWQPKVTKPLYKHTNIEAVKVWHPMNQLDFSLLSQEEIDGYVLRLWKRLVKPMRSVCKITRYRVTWVGGQHYGYLTIPELRIIKRPYRLSGKRSEEIVMELYPTRNTMVDYENRKALEHSALPEQLNNKRFGAPKNPTEKRDKAMYAYGELSFASASGYVVRPTKK